MIDYILDRISDLLADDGRILYTPHLPGADRLVPDEEAVFDALVVTDGILAFDTKAAATYRAAGLCRVPRGSEADVVYYVMPDGRWHVDQHQLYLMLTGKPHLTPMEWVERDVAQRLLDARFIRTVVDTAFYVTQLWQCRLGYVVVVFSWTTDESRTSLGLVSDHWTFRIFVSDEAGPAQLSEELSDGSGYHPRNHEEMQVVVAGL